jgi:hypothetical protein
MQMKSLLVFIILFCVQQVSYPQTNSFHDTAAFYFEELKQTTNEHKNLWELDLYAPILLVDPATREVFANTADSAGMLIQKGKIYTGILPQSVNISNTSLKWSGKHWAMVMLPLPENKNSRINLLCHELFHRAQQQLQFIPSNPENNHLDKKDGRIYLRLELEALKKAISFFPEPEYMSHLKKAFLFRKMRHQLFPGSDSTENLLELNEGICEYTGVVMSGRTKKEMADHFTRRINNFILSDSYIRSFAYETTPVYGYFLSFMVPGWNRNINVKTNLNNFFQTAFNLSSTAGDGESMHLVKNNYAFEQILYEETNRDENLKKLLSEYKKMFIDLPHVELPLIKMNMSFDYTKMVALEDHGTVYPVIRITDNWGILEAQKGAMINSAWKKIHVSYPKIISANHIEGNGWVLKLNNDYMLQKESSSLNYIIKKKD